MPSKRKSRPASQPSLFDLLESESKAEVSKPLSTSKPTTSARKPRHLSYCAVGDGNPALPGKNLCAYHYKYLELRD